MQQFYGELEHELVTAMNGDVRFDSFTRSLYATDASIYEMDPIGVVLPKNLGDVVKAVELARKYEVPVLPRGGGTALAGQSVNHALVLDFSKYMNKLLELDPDAKFAWVEPGIVLDQLNSYGIPHKLKFAPDPATTNRGNIGGAIGNNSCGSHSIVYGKTIDHVIELETVLSDGSVVRMKELDFDGFNAKCELATLEGAIYRGAYSIALDHSEEIDKRYPKILRRVSGYNLDEMLKSPINLAKLIVGSEGTLATVTKAKVRLVTRPGSTALAVIHFETMIEAMEATVLLLDENPSAIELLDNNIVRQGKAHLSVARRMGFVEGLPAALLVVEVAGESAEEVLSKAEKISNTTRKHRLGYHTLLITDPQEQANVWAVRREGLGLIMSMRGDEKPLPFVEDTAVSPDRLPEYIRRFNQLVDAEGTTAAHYGHASVGCIHIRPLVNLKSTDGVERMVRIANQVADLVLEFGGSLSGEHGDGIVRGVFTEKMFGPKLYSAFRDLKRTFDPHGLMNPGKIVDCPPMSENLRISPMGTTQNITTTLDFSDDGGFLGHVEMCNGQGACRKEGSGTMCPSYMATRDEEHSTRGRANALRSVLAGKIPMENFGSKRLFDALDLCLECKGCRAECPSSVDMAKLKYEFLDQYHREHGYTVRELIFANIGKVNEIGAAFAPVSNWMMKVPGMNLVQSLVGVHPKRTLPPFAPTGFSRWLETHSPPPEAGSFGEVILFNDTFMEWNYPNVGKATTILLEKLGYKVSVVPKLCCGRPLMSKGMLSRAKRDAKYNVDLLYPKVIQGIPIVGCEPSCILAFREEYLALLPGDQKAKRVSEGVWLLDEFLSQIKRDREIPVAFRPLVGKVLFQSHCHQKALTGTSDSLDALKMIPDLEVEVLDSGCCGMAGSFGFEKEHYAISMAIGERVLFPAIRNGQSATIVTTGASCHQQVAHGTGVSSFHLAELLVNQLQPPVDID